MAFQKKKEKDYHVCEFCKIKPCMFEICDEVEYKTHCRNYSADAKKISEDKLKGRSKGFVVNQLLG